MPYIGEYNLRQNMRKLGYQFSALDLSSFKAECFAIIAGAYNAREAEKNKKPKPRGRR